MWRSDGTTSTTRSSGSRQRSVAASTPKRSSRHHTSSARTCGSPVNALPSPSAGDARSASRASRTRSGTVNLTGSGAGSTRSSAAGSQPTQPSIPLAEPRRPREVAVDKRTWVQGRPAGYSVVGQGMPVVFLHGWALAQHTFRDVIETIAAQGCRVIAPSMPGFGGSADLPADEFSISGYAAWVIALLDALEVDEPVVVVGHSFGGGVAIRLAHDHPERTRSLVLVNSVGGSSWKKGSTMRSITERPLWDWGLHFPADVWPIRQASRVLPVIAEDLGFITPEVHQLRDAFGFPGMRILQFGFGDGLASSLDLPHNYPAHCVAYTGTHDNDTVVGWFESVAGEASTRTQQQIDREKAYALRYLDCSPDQIHHAMMRAIWRSVASLAITPIQDLLGLGTTARMNVPGTTQGNWIWRCPPGLLTEAQADWLGELTETYGRSPSVSSVV